MDEHAVDWTVTPIQRRAVVTTTSYASQTGSPSVVLQTQTRTSVLPSPTASQNDDEADQNAKASDISTITGSVVGAIIGVAWIITFTMFIIRRNKKKRAMNALNAMYAETGQGGGGADRTSRIRMTPSKLEENGTTTPQPATRVPLFPVARPPSTGQPARVAEQSHVGAVPSLAEHPLQLAPEDESAWSQAPTSFAPDYTQNMSTDPLQPRQSKSSHAPSDHENFAMLSQDFLQDAHQPTDLPSGYTAHA